MSTNKHADVVKLYVVFHQEAWGYNKKNYAKLLKHCDITAGGACIQIVSPLN